jgi:hypothetical protein
MCTKSLLHFISPAHYMKMLHVACLSVHFAVEENARSVIGSMYLFFSYLGGRRWGSRIVQNGTKPARTFCLIAHNRFCCL